MNTIYDKATLTATLNRIDKLTPATTPQWGKMNASQMLEHCSRALDYAVGNDRPKRLLIGRLLGGFMKKQYYNNTPWGKNTPTAPNFKVADTPDFEASKKRLTTLVKQFSEGGEAKCTTHPSAFFGHLTPAQHGLGMYKHLDHHLTQFGV